MGRYGKSVQSYIEELSKFQLTPEQINCIDFLKDLDKKMQIVSAGRGFAKTMISTGFVLWLADEYASHRHKNLEILLVSSQQRMYFHLNKFVEDNKERFSGRIKHTGIFDALMKEKAEFYSQDKQNVSIVYPCMATSKSVRSHRADVVVLDEAAEIKKDVITAAIGCLEGDISKLLMISTPHVPESYFVEVASKPEKFGFDMYMASSENCKWRQHSNKIAKDMLTAAEYASEILGRPPTIAERSVFPAKHIEKCTQDVPTGREGGETSWLEAGIDFGFNNTVYFLTERISPVKRKVIHIQEWKEVPIEMCAPEIASLIKLHSPKLIKADSRPKFNQGQIEKYCNRRIDYIDAGKVIKLENDEKVEEWSTNKEQMVGQLARKVREHQLIIPIVPMTVDFITQLRKYRRKMQTGDDIVDACALSCYQPPVPLGNTTAGCCTIPEPKKRSFLNIPINLRGFRK